MTDLDKLIAAVEAGTATDFRALLTDSDNPAERAKRCGWASSAYKGRLDAALQLHEALLPGCSASIDTDGFADIFSGEAGRYDGSLRLIGRGDVEKQPARAWLLAILRALKAKGDA